MANSKIIFGGEVLIDLTADTVAADKLLKGITAHGANGDAVVGTCTYDANTQDASTVTPSRMLPGISLSCSALAMDTFPEPS